MTNKEKIDFEEYLDAAIGKLLSEAKKAEKFAQRQRELIQIFTKTKRRIWTQEADDEWLELF